MTDALTRRGMMIGSGAVLAASAGAARADGATVKIANASGGLNLVMGELMKEQRFLESFGLAPDILGVADGSRIMGAVISGSVDLSTMSGFGQVFPAIERGADIKVIGGGALVPALALFTGKAAVTSLKDLEGKTVGAGSIGALVQQLTVILLKKYGVDVAKVRFVNVGSSADVVKAVSAGTVDAGAGAASLMADADRYHIRLVPHGNMAVELAQYTYQGAWASSRKIAAERDLMVKSLAAYAKLYRFVQSPSAKGAFFKARRVVFPNETEGDHQLEWDFIQTYKPFAVNLAIGPDRIRYMQQVNLDFHIQQSMLPYGRVADMSLAADALKLL
jgi:ABC-type nitrate/sulfonate/bicarbonate transport system substrate-binding protein